jgi:hypothetical protein
LVFEKNANFFVGNWQKIVVITSTPGKYTLIAFQMLYQRMASDTDLWLGLKARQAKYKNVFGGKKELSPVEDERSYVTLEGDQVTKSYESPFRPKSFRTIVFFLYGQMTSPPD